MSKGIIFENPEDPPTVTIQQDGKEIFRLNHNGSVTLAVSANKAARFFANCLTEQYNLRIDRTGEVRQQYYINGMKRALVHAKSMTKDELLQRLEDEIKHRETLHTFNVLQGDG